MSQVSLFGEESPAPPAMTGEAVLSPCGRYRVVCGWGVKGELLQRGAAVRALLRGASIPLHYLRLTQGGHPEHPLYLPGALTPVPWSDAP